MDNNQPQPTNPSSQPNPPTQPQYRQFTPQPKNREITPVHIVVLLFILAIIVIIIIALVQIFRKNPYGEQIKITNLETYYKDFSTDTKDSIFNTLYNIVANNNPDIKISDSGAKIREGSTTNSYNKSTNIYTSDFIVDLENLQQSYAFQVVWSPDKNNSYLEDLGYTVLATCPTAEQLIYDPFECVDGSSDNGVYGDIIMSVLPINIAYYENNYSVYTAYDIVAQVRDNQLTVIINDKTGGNHNAALNQLREKGINPDNYTIVYNDLSSELTPARAPDAEDF